MALISDIISFKDVSLSFGGVKALSEVSFDIKEGSLDDFMNRMDLGDPDPSNHSTGFGSADEIADWFNHERTDDWRQHD